MLKLPIALLQIVFYYWEGAELSELIDINPADNDLKQIFNIKFWQGYFKVIANTKDVKIALPQINTLLKEVLIQTYNPNILYPLIYLGADITQYFNITDSMKYGDNWGLHRITPLIYARKYNDTSLIKFLQRRWRYFRFGGEIPNKIISDISSQDLEIIKIQEWNNNRLWHGDLLFSKSHIFVYDQITGNFIPLEEDFYNHTEIPDFITDYIQDPKQFYSNIKGIQYVFLMRDTHPGQEYGLLWL